MLVVLQQSSLGISEMLQARLEGVVDVLDKLYCADDVLRPLIAENEGLSSRKRILVIENLDNPTTMTLRSRLISLATGVPLLKKKLPECIGILVILHASSVGRSSAPGLIQLHHVTALRTAHLSRSSTHHDPQLLPHLLDSGKPTIEAFVTLSKLLLTKGVFYRHQRCALGVRDRLCDELNSDKPYQNKIDDVFSSMQSEMSDEFVERNAAEPGTKNVIHDYTLNCDKEEWVKVENGIRLDVDETMLANVCVTSLSPLTFTSFVYNMYFYMPLLYEIAEQCSKNSKTKKVPLSRILETKLGHILPQLSCEASNSFLQIIKSLLSCTKKIKSDHEKINKAVMLSFLSGNFNGRSLGTCAYNITTRGQCTLRQLLRKFRTEYTLKRNLFGLLTELTSQGIQRHKVLMWLYDYLYNAYSNVEFVAALLDCISFVEYGAHTQAGGFDATSFGLAALLSILNICSFGHDTIPSAMTRSLSYYSKSEGLRVSWCRGYEYNTYLLEICQTPRSRMFSQDSVIDSDISDR